MSKAIWLYVAAGAAFTIPLTHSFLGERLVFPRLFRCQDLPLLRRDPVFTRAILRWAWHLTSLAWLAFAVMLFAMASNHPFNTAHLIAVLFGVSGAIACITTKGKHPAWPVFAIVAVASWLGGA
jgi:hypothetical protein